MEHNHSTTPQGYKTTITSTYAYLADGQDKVYKGVPIHILAGREGKAASQTCICITGSVQATCQSLSEGKLAAQLL